VLWVEKDANYAGDSPSRQTFRRSSAALVAPA
jgi:hypothetical protein